MSIIPLKSDSDCSKSMPFLHCESRYLVKMKIGGFTTKFSGVFKAINLMELVCSSGNYIVHY